MINNYMNLDDKFIENVRIYGINRKIREINLNGDVLNTSDYVWTRNRNVRVL